MIRIREEEEEEAKTGTIIIGSDAVPSDYWSQRPHRRQMRRHKMEVYF